MNLALQVAVLFVICKAEDVSGITAVVFFLAASDFYTDHPKIDGAAHQ